MSNTEQKLETLLKAYINKTSNIEASLQPGLTRNDIDAKTSWFPSSLPEEIYNLYQWRNGQQEMEETNGNIFPLLFMEMMFLPLEDAREEYESLMSTYGQEIDATESGVDLASTFPFAAFNGGWYVLPCDGHHFSTDEEKPIICVHEDIGVEFLSVQHMLDTCIDWINHPTYSVKEACIGSDNDRVQIWEKHNPGLFDIEAIDNDEIDEDELDRMEEELSLGFLFDKNGKEYRTWIKEFTTKNSITVPPGYKPERAARFIVINEAISPAKMVACCFETTNSLEKYLTKKLAEDQNNANHLYVVDFSEGTPAKHKVNDNGAIAKM